MTVILTQGASVGTDLEGPQRLLSPEHRPGQHDGPWEPKAKALQVKGLGAGEENCEARAWGPGGD